MSFSINTNLASLQSQKYLEQTNNFLNKTIQEVTSGLRIVNSGDDAAGLAIANGYRSQEAVLTQGIQNANDGLSQLQIADGGLSNISQLLDRASTLATESASGTFTGDRNVLNTEFQSVLTEINRQAQAIGLNNGGTFAKNLSVLIGGGQASNGISATSNGSVAIDLSHSTVDTASLGLSGVQAIGQAGTDIGAGSATTSLAQILANATNSGSETNPGFTTFYLKGPGFAGNGIQINVDTSNLGSTSDLVAAVNAAIQNAASAGTQQATALQNANVVASINTDATGKQQLTFNSSTQAFQVEAGDRTANALLGNFGQNASIEGTDSNPTIATNGGGTSDQLTLAVDGGPSFTVTVTSGAAVSKAQIVKDLNNDTGSGLHFANYATASLDGDQIVIQSKNNSANSSVAITSTTLATSLGLSTTKATAANASTGASLSSYVTAAKDTAAGTTAFGAAGAGAITFRFQGAGQTTPTDVAINVTATETVSQAIAALGNAVSSNATLKAAGIDLTTSTAGDALTFTSTKGEQFNVQVTGDTQNLLGFGSFVTGANGAVDYSALTGSSNYDDTTATGTDTFQISLNGAGSSANSIAVDLTQGDATAATVTSTDSAATPVQVTANNNVLNLAVNGHNYTVTLTPGGSLTKSNIAAQINTQISAQGTATVNSSNQVVITSNTKGAGGSVQIENGTANTLLGFAAAGPVKGTSRTGASVAQALNQAFASNATLQAAGLVADYNVTQANKITIQSNNGTYFRVDSSGSTASGSVIAQIADSTPATAGAATGTVTGSVTTDGTHNDFKITVDGGTQQDIILAQGAFTIAQIASQLNANPLFAGATASVDGTGHLVITSNTTTGSSTIALAAGTNDVLGRLGLSVGTSTGAAATSGYNIGGGNDVLSISVDGGTAQQFTLTNGANQTANNIVSDLSGLLGATASVDNGHLVIKSNSTGSGSSVVINAPTSNANATLGLTAATTYGGSQAETGFGVTGVSFTGNISSAAPANSAQVDVGGASETTDFAFTPIVNGSDQQNVTINAADASGAQQSLSVTLQNNGTARNGATIDQAIDAINTALQQSNNSTLQKIVAVKDNSSGTEQIKFLSTLSSFQVAVGTTAGGTGLNSSGSQGLTVSSAQAAGGSTSDITTVSSAEAAVTALSQAVSKLGASQAVVGRGENQFNYAINLANSQLTNFQAAESTIRDADLATESANLTKSQILLQAGVAALAQANSAPQQVLSLLKG
ncbi:MAG TPA: flagellin [Bryobacteraceae bacterium]